MNEPYLQSLGCFGLLAVVALAGLVLYLYRRLEVAERKLGEIEEWLPSLHRTVTSLWEERQAAQRGPGAEPGGEVAARVDLATGEDGAEVRPTTPQPALRHDEPGRPGVGADVESPVDPDVGAEPVPQPGTEPDAISGAPGPQPTPKPWSDRLEENLGARLPVWIGAIALALSGAFLVQYSVDQGWLRPVVRIALAVGFGLALETLAAFLRRSSERVAAGLAAAGIAVLYGAWLAAVHLYGLLSLAVGFGLMALTTAAAVVLALLYGPIVAIVGMVGGFLAPFWLSVDDLGPFTLFPYLTLLHLGVLVVSRRRRWFALPVLSLAASLSWVGYGLASLKSHQDPSPVLLFLFAVMACWLVWFVLHFGDRLASADPQARIGLGVAVCAVVVSLVLAAGLVTLGEAVDGRGLLILVPAVAGLVVLGRLRPRLEVLAWLGAAWGCLSTVWWAMVWAAGAQTGLLEASAFPAGLVVAVQTGLVLVLVGGGFWALRGSAGPGRWATFAIICAFAQYLAASLWPAAWVPWRWIGDTGLALAAAAVFTVAAHVLGSPLAAASARGGMGDGGTSWSAAASVRPLFAFAGATFGCLAVFEGLQGWPRVVVLAAGVAGIAGWVARRDLRDLAFLPAYGAGVATWQLVALGLPAPDRTPALAWLEVAGRATALLVAVRWSAFAEVGGGAASLAQGHPPGRRVGTGLHPRTLSYGLRGLSVLLLAVLLYDLVALGTRAVAPASSLARQAVLPLLMAVASIALLAAARRGWGRVGPIEAWGGGLLLVLAWADYLLSCCVSENPVLRGVPVGEALIFNHLLWVYGGGALVFAAASRELGLLRSGAVAKWLDPLAEVFRRILDLTGLVLLLVLVTLEIRQGFRGSYLDVPSPSPSAESWAISLAWLIFGMALLVLGIRRGDRFLRGGALGVTGLAVVKVFVFDVGGLGGLYRVFSFLGLGASLLVLAWLYQRFVFQQPEGAMDGVKVGGEIDEAHEADPYPVEER